MSDYREIAVHAGQRRTIRRCLSKAFSLPLLALHFLPRILFFGKNKNNILKINKADLAAHFHIKGAKNKVNPWRLFLCVQYAFVFPMTDFGKSWVKHCSVLLLSIGGSVTRLVPSHHCFQMGNSGSVFSVIYVLPHYTPLQVLTGCMYSAN